MTLPTVCPICVRERLVPIPDYEHTSWPCDLHSSARPAPALSPEFLRQKQRAVRRIERAALRQRIARDLVLAIVAGVIGGAMGAVLVLMLVGR